MRSVMILAGALAIAACSGGDDGGEAAPEVTGPAPAEATDPPATDPSTSSTTEAPTTTTRTPATEPPATAPPPTDPPTTPATEPPATDPPTTTSPPATDPPATDPPATLDGPACRFLGVDDFDDMQVELEFVNSVGDVESITVTYALLDGTGTRFSTHEEWIQFPGADQQFRKESDTLTELPAGVDAGGVECQVLEIAEGFSFGEAEPPADPTACEFVEVDSFGDIQIELTVTSPFEDTTDVQATYALYADGIRFDSSVSIIELVGPGETVRSSEDTLTQPPAWSDSGTIICDVRAVEVIDF